MNIKEFNNNVASIYKIDSGKSNINSIDDFLERPPKYILSLDWTGETDEKELKNFILKSYRELTENELDIKSYESWERKVEDNQFHRGEYIYKKLVFFGELLRKNKVQLCLLNDDSDQYHIFLLPASEFEKFDGVKNEDEGWFVETYRDLKKAEFWDDAKVLSHNLKPEEGRFKNSHVRKKQSWFLKFALWLDRQDFSTKSAFAGSLILAITIIILKLMKE